ncbi:MAG: penicillin-binding transpeptidase domain-containing protein [Acidimicrobiales bacterium]
MLVMVACLGGILARLLLVQGVDAATYQADARSEYVHEVSFLGERGSILDRNGDELAMSVPMTTVYADPYQVSNPLDEAEALAPVLGTSVSALRGELSEASGFVYLARTVPDATAAKVEKLISGGNMAGIYTMQEPKRFDPAGQLAAPLIGVVGTDGQGLSGLEYKYNALLEGKPGRLLEDMDPAGGLIPGGLQEYQAPVRGDDLVLSIAEPLQYEAEEALARAIVAAQAQSGMALIMDSRTGELLAVAQLTMPTPSEPVTMDEPPALPVWFVPPELSTTGPGHTEKQVAASQPVEAPDASAFTNVYEPGSVEKLVTISAALDTGAIAPTEYFSVPNTYAVDGSIFSDAWDHPTLEWTASDILAHSSDIGSIEIAQRLGMSNLLPYIHAFGIGEKTGVDFPGESAGLVPGPSQWSGTTIATVPIGQGLAVTAVQMLAAYNTIAEDGTYIPPKLADGYIDADGNEHLFPPAATHRVVSSLVAREMTSMLEGVVRVGTGAAASLEPYTVAGKTGTALVPSPQGGYIDNDFVSSFVGFVPAEDPAITAMVVVEGTHQYGAEASAPVFAMIARDALQYLGVPPHKPLPPMPGVPQASVYGGEGEAAGPALPGLSGAPDVLVNSGPSPATSGAKTTTTTTSAPAPISTTTTAAPATSPPPASATTSPVASATTVSTTSGLATTTTAPSAAATTTTAPSASATTTTAPSAAATTTTAASAAATTTTALAAATTTTALATTATVPPAAATTATAPLAGSTTTTAPGALSTTTAPAAVTTTSVPGAETTVPSAVTTTSAPPAANATVPAVGSTTTAPATVPTTPALVTTTTGPAATAAAPAATTALAGASPTTASPTTGSPNTASPTSAPAATTTIAPVTTRPPASSVP